VPKQGYLLRNVSTKNDNNKKFKDRPSVKKESDGSSGSSSSSWLLLEGSDDFEGPDAALEAFAGFGKFNDDFCFFPTARGTIPVIFVAAGLSFEEVVDDVDEALGGGKKENRPEPPPDVFGFFTDSMS
jgi:hypothetical protein